MNLSSLLLAGSLLVPSFLSGAAETGSSDFELLTTGIRDDDHGTVERLARVPGIVSGKDEQGNTPLILAAMLGKAESVEILLKAGADPNATNKAGVTALLRAATHPDKVRLLLARGAKADIASALGQTPLLLAARSAEATESVRLLLQHKADPNTKNVFGSTPLMAAAAAGNLAAAKLLVEHGANLNAAPLMSSSEGDAIFGGFRTPLMWAALRGDTRLVEYLLDKGADPNVVTGLGTALTQASWLGHAETAKLLLDRGANLHQPEPMSGFTALHWASSDESGRADLVNLLLQRGANVNAEGGEPVDAFLGDPQTPVRLASRRGETAVLRALLKAGGKPSEIPQQSPSSVLRAIEPDSASVWSALAAAVPPLQRTGVESYQSFVRHVSRQHCASCHQQYLPLAAVGLAADDRVPINAEQKEEVTRITLNAHRYSELDAQPLFHPEPAHSYGYALLALKATGIREPAASDGLLHHLAAIQHADGHWPLNLLRPPMQSTDVTATALAIFSLRNFGWPAREAEFASRVERAKAWLLKVEPTMHEEHVFRLLGLAWAGVPAKELSKFTKALIAQQREDGGWSQLPGLTSDAYATGQALFALHEAAGLRADDPNCKRAIRFLLNTQYEDGTWHVRRRAFPFQPTMDSGFPHGRDSWISAAGTSWAAMALALMVEASPSELAALAASRGSIGNIKGEAPHAQARVVHAQPVDFAKEIEPLLARSCTGCHSGERARSNYQVTRRELLLGPGNLGAPSVVPGSSRDSLLVKYVKGEIPDMEMPPLNQRERYPALTPEEIARLSAWIDQGAVWPDRVASGGTSETDAPRL